MPTKQPIAIKDGVYQEESCTFWTGADPAGLRAFSEWRIQDLPFLMD